jgi:ABC-2 type transport system permease protein
MRKLLAIVWKENYERFTDRAGLLYMLAAPLALSIILGLAFSGLSGNSSDISISDIPVAIVNLDEGSAQARYGDIFVQAFVPPNPENEDPDNTLHHLFDAREMTDEAEARALVERGDLDAILVIPPDFSQSLTLDAAAFAGGPENVSLGGHAELTAYWNSGAQINWSIFRDVVQGIANGIANSNIAINVTVSGLIQANPLFGLQMATGAFNDTFAEIAQAASQPGANPINLRQVNVQGEEVGQQFDPLQYFGPAFAIFFTGFTAVFGAASVLQEQRDWTLQRMIVTPTPSLIILAGKMIAAFVGGVLQMVMLIVSMTLIASLLLLRMVSMRSMLRFRAAVRSITRFSCSSA